MTMHRVKALGSLEHRPAKRALEDWAAVGVLDTVSVIGGNGLETDAFVVSDEFRELVAAVYGAPVD